MLNRLIAFIKKLFKKEKDEGKLKDFYPWGY